MRFGGEYWKLLRAAASRLTNDSGILVKVPSNPIRFVIPLALVLAAAPHLWAQAPSSGAPPAPAQAPPPAASSAAPPAQQPPAPPSQPTPALPTPEPPPATTSTPPPPPPKTLAVVIVDPAHGGTDPGARGASGIVESEVVLSYARLLRISLEAQGLRVLLTRQANEGPSFDDRSKIANAQRGAVFISLHVGSTGQPGTVRVYSIPRAAAAQGFAPAARGGLIPWDRAQFGFLDQSRRLAELIQIQMAQRFRGSSETPFEAPIRQLRTVAGPAVAIEISSVSVSNRSLLDQMSPGIADGIARAVTAFRTVYDAGAGGR